MIRILIIFLSLIATNLNANCSTNSNYEDLGDGTIKDKSTGLTWMKCPFGMTWSASGCTGQSKRTIWRKAILIANYYNDYDGYADHKNWRLPTLKELESITDASCPQLTIDQTVFPNTLPTGYWTITEDRNSYAHAMIVYFFHGKSYLSNKQAEWFVRLVRD